MLHTSMANTRLLTVRCISTASSPTTMACSPTPTWRLKASATMRQWRRSALKWHRSSRPSSARSRASSATSVSSHTIPTATLWSRTQNTSLSILTAMDWSRSISVLGRMSCHRPTVTTTPSASSVRTPRLCQYRNTGSAVQWLSSSSSSASLPT